MLLMGIFGRRQGGWRRATVSSAGYVDLLIVSPTWNPTLKKSIA